MQQVKPTKIVEVGVAAGGTTAVVLRCMERMAYPYEMYSIDLSVSYYRDKNKTTGYLADSVKKELVHGNHRFLLGSVVPNYLANIGENIDFVILDTIHKLPGELLDFLCLLPYLRPKGVVCLHDIAIHQYVAKLRHMIAPAVLFHTVAAKKILRFADAQSEVSYPNIGAIEIGLDTDRHIANIFLSLTLPWQYSPAPKELSAYEEFFCNHYEPKLYRIYREALKMNLHNLYPLPKELNFFRGKIIIYGGGTVGLAWRQQLAAKNGVIIVAWLDQHADILSAQTGLPLETPQWPSKDDFDLLLVAVHSSSLADSIVKELIRSGVPASKIFWQRKVEWEFMV